MSERDWVNIELEEDAIVSFDKAFGMIEMEDVNYYALNSYMTKDQAKELAKALMEFVEGKDES